MDALKKSVERAGCTMDSIIHLEVFLCLPHADNVPMPTGKARFDAHKAQYDALNKIYGTYFSPGKAPSRACMAVEMDSWRFADRNRWKRIGRHFPGHASGVKPNGSASCSSFKSAFSR